MYLFSKHICKCSHSLRCCLGHYFQQRAQNQDRSQREKAGSVTATDGEGDRDEDEDLLQDFEEEISDLSVPTEKIQEIKQEMQKEFDNIINEV